MPFPRRAGSRALAALVAASCGCAGVSISPDTPVPIASRMAPVTLVVGELAPRAGLRKPLYGTLQREIDEKLRHSGLASQIVSEADLPPGGVSGEAYLLRYRVVEDEEVGTGSAGGCFVALMVAGSFLLVPLFFMGLCTSTVEHRLTIEAKLFDVRHTKVVSRQDALTSEVVNLYDPAALFHLFRRECRVDVQVTAGMDQASPRGSGAVAIRDRVAEEAARQLLAKSLPDISTALGRPYESARAGQAWSF